MRTRERERAVTDRSEGGEYEREREIERDSREVIYRKLPRSPESHYKHWAIACMWPNVMCGERARESQASERASERLARRRLLLAPPLGKKVKNRLSKIREMRRV